MSNQVYSNQVSKYDEQFEVVGQTPTYFPSNTSVGLNFTFSFNKVGSTVTVFLSQDQSNISIAPGTTMITFNGAIIPEKYRPKTVSIVTTSLLMYYSSLSGVKNRVVLPVFVHFGGQLFIGSNITSYPSNPAPTEPFASFWGPASGCFTYTTV